MLPGEACSLRRAVIEHEGRRAIAHLGQSEYAFVALVVVISSPRTRTFSPSRAISRRGARMTSRPNLTIVLCTYNRAASLRLTLASLAAQITPATLAWELLVVDNNSTDATPQVVENFKGTTGMPVRSRFVAQQGLSHARTAGVRDAPPAWLAQGSFHGLLAIMDQPTPMDVFNAYRAPCVWGANMAFRREVFDRVGLFDTRRGLVGARRYGGEETELVQRALAEGCRAVYDPSITVWHRIARDRMRIRYLSRVSFDRAECEARVRPSTARLSLLGIPLGLYRAAAANFAYWLTAVTLRRPDTIQRWLDWCAVMGSLWGAWRRRLDRMRTSRHGASSRPL